MSSTLPTASPVSKTQKLEECPLELSNIPGRPDGRPRMKDKHQATPISKTHEFTSTGPKHFTLLSSRISNLYQWFWDSWALEYCSVAFSVGCLLGMIATLVSFDGRPLAEWRSTLSINTILSILGTGMKGTALLATGSALGQFKWVWYNHRSRPLEDFQTFDDATRGPSGALMLMLRLPQSQLALVGALVTLISLGSDAFVQASASQVFRVRGIPGASVPVCHAYFTNTRDYSLDPMMKAALYAGVFNAEVDYIENRPPGIGYTTDNNPAPRSNTSSTVSPVCGTGNCTFEPYATLAMRHQCSDVTSKLRLDPMSTATDFTVYLEVPNPYGENLTASYIENYFIAGLNQTFLTALNMTANPTIDPSLGDPGHGNSSTGTPNNGTFLANLIITNVYMILGNALGNTTNTFQAFHCNLHLGLQVYTASVERGVFVETPGRFIPGNWTFLILGSDSEDDNLFYWSLKVDISGAEKEVKFGYNAWTALSNYLAGSPSLLTGEIVHSFDPQIDSNDAIEGIFFNSNSGLDPNSSGIYNTFDGISTSVTSYFRTATLQTAPGTAQELETYIKARWWFMLLPIVMVLLASVFTIVTSIQSQRQGIPSWRTSTLAAMFSEYAGESGPQKSAVENRRLIIGPPAELSRVVELENWAGLRTASLRQR